MDADSVEVSWDDSKSDWTVKIEIGEEVIRRHCKLPRNVEEQTLRSAAEKIVNDEGYEPEASEMVIHH